MNSLPFVAESEYREALLEEDGPADGMDTDKGPESKGVRLHPSATSIARYLFITLVLMALLFSIPALLNHPPANSPDGFSSMSTSRQEGTWDQCGNSPADAIERGCRFDVMSFSWLPLPCFDSSLSAEFLALRDWHWYLDSTDEQEVLVNEVELGTHDQLFVTWEYHLNHCTYMWKKLHRAILREGPIDSYIGNYSHTLHCAEVLVGNSVPLAEKNTFIFIKYPTCIL